MSLPRLLLLRGGRLAARCAGAAAATRCAATAAAAAATSRLPPAFLRASSSLPSLDAIAAALAQLESGSDVEAAVITLRAAAAASDAPAAAALSLGRWHLWGDIAARDCREGLRFLYAATTHPTTSADAAYWIGRAWTQMDSLRPARGAVGLTADPTPELSGTTSDPAAAAGVIAEVRAFRKQARRDRAIREAGGIPSTGPGSRALPSTPAARLLPDALPRSPLPAHAASDAAAVDSVPLRADWSRAYAWLFFAASRDHADAQVALGNLCMRAEPPQVAQAVAWYELAAGLAPTAGRATDSVGGGEGSSASSPRRGDESSATSSDGSSTSEPATSSIVVPTGHPDALYNLGMLYYEGVPGAVPADPRRAAGLFAAAADAMDPSALFWCGHACYVGNAAAGVPQSLPPAIRYLELAASQGHGGAAYYLSNHYAGEATRAGEGGSALACGQQQQQSPVERKAVWAADMSAHPPSSPLSSVGFDVPLVAPTAVLPPAGTASAACCGGGGCGSRRGGTGAPTRPSPAALIASSLHFRSLALAARDPDALFDEADALYHGRGGRPADVRAALALYDEAGAGGNADALVCAGAILFHGLPPLPPGGSGAVADTVRRPTGTPTGPVPREPTAPAPSGTLVGGAAMSPDYAGAMARYEAAAQLGSIPAWSNVAAMTALGQGTPSNLPAARYITGTVIPALQRAAADAAAAVAAIDEMEASAAGTAAAGAGVVCGGKSAAGS